MKSSGQWVHWGHSIMGGLVLTLAPACGNGSSSSDDAGEGESATDGQAEGAEAGDAGDGGSEGGADGGGADDGPPAEVCAEMSFDNVVDEAACPNIQGQGVEPEPADAVEFCRRAFIDLLGASPTAVEYEENCKDRTYAEIVDDFMARPAYVRRSQRMWADVFQMNSGVTYYQYIADLDALAGQLHAGEITLDAFGEIAATHPGFLGRWDGVDLVGHNFLAHFHRDANPAERLALMPLWQMWEERPLEDPLHAGTRRVVLNTLRCAEPNSADCYSDFWGDHTVIIDPPVPGDTNPDGPNVIDQALLSEAQWEVLRTPGRLIVEQGGFYEAYVDRTLERYLGYDAGNELPEVRQALVELLAEAGGDVRAVDREITTSILYVSSNVYDEELKDNPDDYDPQWWHGPVKQMDAEAWLASAQKLVGVPVGSCDHRYPEVQSGAQGMHPHAYPTLADGTPDYAFRDDARLLGGCPDQVASFRENRAGLIPAMTQATLTKELCESAMPGAPIYPVQFIEDPDDKSTESLTTAANQTYAAALIRPIPTGAEDALVAGVEGCRDATECLPADFAFHTCRLILKSADFLFY